MRRAPRSGTDLPTLVAGVALAALGGVLLLGELEVAQLGFGRLAPAVCAALGAILVAGGVSRAGRGAAEVGIGSGLLLLSALMALRELGLWFSDAVSWPLVLVAAGGALIWRQSLARPAPPAPASPRAAGTRPDGAPPGPAAPPKADEPASASRVGIGVALVLAAALAFLQSTGALGTVRDAALVAVVAVVVLGAVFAPWIVRLGRSLAQERAERVRSQERAEMAAHLHDSVLQTLAMVQRHAGDPRQVGTLARRQERELRTWLEGREAGADAGPRLLGAALEQAAAAIEGDHGVRIDVVAVGDAELDEAGEALVAAAREAMLNAAKFAGDGGPVDVYGEATGVRLQVFVRDRGPGFDPAAAPPDRRGVRESIVGRMARHGGRAAVRRAPEGGTEVELVLERGAS